jgi:hypothetical protein
MFIGGAKVQIGSIKNVDDGPSMMASFHFHMPKHSFHKCLASFPVNLVILK